MYTKIKCIGILLWLFSTLGCNSSKRQTTQNWCEQGIREELKKLPELKITDSWFKVYAVGENVFAIVEPYNFQEVISYLILGSDRALLFDTGMGLSSLSNTVKEITKLPITVLNSHTHYDHIGSNYEFEDILAIRTPFTLNRATNGLEHELVKHELKKEALCLEKLSKLDTTAYHIRSFPISKFVTDGDTIALGHRTLKIIAVPGHTPDAIALLDEEHGYLWTGDTFYEAPIWLFDEGTDLSAYQRSITKLAHLSAGLTKIFSAHNIPVSKPIRLVELAEAFNAILDGSKKALDDKVSEYSSQTSVQYTFEHFSFVIRKDLLLQKGIQL